MPSRLTPLLTAALLLAVALTPAAAQRRRRFNSQIKSTSTGFFIGMGYESNSIQRTDVNSVTETGNGGGLVLGYGFNRHWSLYLDGSGATMNADGGGTYTLGHFDLGARVHFRSGTNVVVPFVQFGVTGRAVSASVGPNDFTGSGGGFSVGGGFNAHFNPAWAFSLALTGTFGSFDEFRVNNSLVNNGSVSANSARLHLGLVWFPGA